MGYLLLPLLLLLLASCMATVAVSGWTCANKLAHAAHPDAGPRILHSLLYSACRIAAGPLRCSVGAVPCCVLLLQSGQNKQPEAVLLLNIRCLLHAA